MRLPMHKTVLIVLVVAFCLAPDAAMAYRRTRMEGLSFGKPNLVYKASAPDTKFYTVRITGTPRYYSKGWRRITPRHRGHASLCLGRRSIRETTRGRRSRAGTSS